MKAEDLTRIVNFLHNIEARSATRVEAWRWGQAFFNEKFPVKWDMNYLRLEKADGTATAQLIAEEAERVQGEAGLEHRKVHVDDEITGARFAADFTALGWKVTRILVMARYHLDMTRPKHLPVEERTDEEMRAYMELWDRGKHDITQDEIDQLAGARAHLLEVIDGRNLTAMVDGEVAGWCEFYTDGDLAQVENVCTFEKFRNRGVASSVIMTGIEKAAEAGAGLTFLLADADDWPKALYEKLGFEQVGYLYEYLKTQG